MQKTGIEIEIPSFGSFSIRTLVSDYTGTLAYAGRLVQGVDQRLVALTKFVDIHIITADTFGTAAEQLRGLPVNQYRLQSEAHDAEKAEYVSQKVGDTRCIASLGNGNNDRLLLKTVKNGGGLAIAVDNGEGCSVETLLNAHILIAGATHALDLLLEKKRCIATLRR
jgi:soluble P-type ATPase